MKKTPRFKKDPGGVGGLRLQERDIKIIKLVHDYRFLDSKQIQALLDSSNQGILRRLKKLHHHDYLDRPKSQLALAEPLSGGINLVYALGDKGADLLAERFGIDRGKILWKEKNREVKERHIEHTLMISNFRACLSLALEATPGAKLPFWIRENPQELKDHVYFKEGDRQRRLSIVPDGFFGIELPIKGPERKVYFFLEADRSTMTNTRFLNKIRAYWLWWKQGGQKKKFGIENFRVLTLTKTRRRMDNLIRVTQKADDKQTGSYMFWFATEEHIDLKNPQTILGSIWQTSSIKDREFHSLLE